MATAPSFSSLSDTVSMRLQHRLIAVWALAEGVLGGILHALHLPVTGLVVGSIAVCCLSLLARFRRRRGDLLKATILVLLVKAMLSPHAPLAAYIAVLSQGLLAELFFFSGKNFRLNCLLFGFFTQLQSALLHIGKLVLVFGIDLWTALDEYMGKIAQTLGLENGPFTVYLAAIYVAVHALAGILIGLVAANLPSRLPTISEISAEELSPAATFPLNIEPKPKKKRLKLQFSLVVVWLVLLAVFLQSYFGIGPALLPQHKIFQILIRSVLIVSVWYFVISPLLMRILKKWLAGKKNQLQTELETIVNLLPEMGALLKKSWQQSADNPGLKRLRRFVKLAFRQLFILPS
ncbi:hypothetical protein I5M27_03475 [Adhaeribacter sp. BT258]|uniref:Uncharacterized protein n=1 Tax=Adhaeribacter terrigena TaxID=2793070 RepID=A0ABS1BY58_9BACT|nr:hypothetical protein [Adhaeribacter terrigena]MBK0402030.1 hypothetical protein [Adhaeribacter terrigena]